MDFNRVDSVILAGTCWQLKTLVSSLASHCASQLATASTSETIENILLFNFPFSLYLQPFFLSWKI